MASSTDLLLLGSEIARVLNGARVAEFDGHVYFDEPPVETKNKITYSGIIEPAGEGTHVTFTLAITP